MITWKTETRKVADLKEWEINPRKISEKEYQELQKSVDKLGNWDSLVVNTDGTVIAGNQRLRVHRERGDEVVEVKVPDRLLSEKEIKEIGIKSNRHSGEWDMDILAEGFGDLLGELGIEDIMPVTVEGFDDEFSLKSGDREPFRQMTFTFADEQADCIEEAIKEIKTTDEYKTMDMFNNENSNGNALYTIIVLWQEQRKLK